jgi:peptidoglycan/LPS O-acetylase OafA/YrhL
LPATVSDIRYPCRREPFRCISPNNLTALRFIAASLVLYGHCFIFLGLRDPMFLSWLPLGPLGVYVFFTISGYLISESWVRDPNLARFFARRALRIFPALIVCTVLSIIVLGPLLTSLPLADYFANPYTRGYLQNIWLYIVYYLPGVFETNRVPNAVNGSLWSLPVGFVMYIVLAVLGLLRANRWVVLAVTIVWALTATLWSQRSTEMFVVYNFDVRQVFLCGIYFMVGAVFQRFGLQRWFSLSNTLAAATILLCLERSVPLLQHAAWVLLPFVVLSFGLAHSPLLERLTRRGDYSYGMYIYAFPIQQAVAYLQPDIGIEAYLLVSFFSTVSVAALSWQFLEQRALAFKPRKPGRPDHIFDS